MLVRLTPLLFPVRCWFFLACPALGSPPHASSDDQVCALADIFLGLFPSHAVWWEVFEASLAVFCLWEVLLLYVCYGPCHVVVVGNLTVVRRMT